MLKLLHSSVLDNDGRVLRPSTLLVTRRRRIDELREELGRLTPEEIRVHSEDGVVDLLDRNGIRSYHPPPRMKRTTHDDEKVPSDEVIF